MLKASLCGGTFSSASLIVSMPDELRQLQVALQVGDDRVLDLAVGDVAVGGGDHQRLQRLVRITGRRLARARPPPRPAA
jgi:hypothetical protein